MISIIIAVKDNKEYTRKCVESIENNTNIKYEIIFIDNASGQETVGYLNSLPYKYIRNQENKGCAYAWNQGIKSASGEYVCIINNDIEVPANWLLKLKEFYEKHSFVLVSPCMREGELNYNLENYNKAFANTLKNRIFIDEFRGVCLFTKKDLFDIIGFFDENFQIGKFEDEDLFLRIKAKNFSSAVTSTVVIHHYGSKTIKNIKKINTSFEDNNRKYFRGKWKKKYL